MTIVEARELLGTLDGATIAASDFDDSEGFHLFLQDGRILVIVGACYLSILRPDNRSLN